MDGNNQRITLDEIKQLDIVDYLAAQGFQPETVKKNGTDHWYLSPLRTEGDASFKVNQTKNRWFDFGLYKGGNLVDFCLLYFKCTIPELLDKFSLQRSADLLPAVHFDHHEGLVEEAPLIRILSERELFRYPLKNFLYERAIPIEIACRFCREVDYEMNGHQLYAIGFKNNAGGYELRDSKFKRSSSPKEITTIDNGADAVHVFEGFMDFLSWKVMHPEVSEKAFDFVVLNGAGMFERARPVLAKYATKHLWLDRDATGMGYTKYALSLKEGYIDESELYRDYKDLNDYLRLKVQAPKLLAAPELKPRNRLRHSL
jgi:hypothetical protein